MIKCFEIVASLAMGQLPRSSISTLVCMLIERCESGVCDFRQDYVTQHSLVNLDELSVT